MSPLRHSKSIHTPLADTSNLSHAARLHGGKLPHRYGRFQPYIARIPSQKAMHSHSIPELPPTLLDQIRHTQDAALNITSQKKDASRLREFLLFCEGLGISACNALPAREDILLAWASSYAGRIAGKTVSALVWRGSPPQNSKRSGGTQTPILISQQEGSRHDFYTRGPKQRFQQIFRSGYLRTSNLSFIIFLSTPKWRNFTANKRLEEV
jgi:hypothetical protein